MVRQEGPCVRTMTEHEGAVQVSSGRVRGKGEREREEGEEFCG